MSFTPIETQEQFDAALKDRLQRDRDAQAKKYEGWTSPEDLQKVKDELAKGGVGTGVCGPRVRTITACQGSEICPSGCIDTYSLAKELDARYFGRELPHKFKFGVTGCMNNCLKAEENDVGIKGGMLVSLEESSCIKCGVCEKACRESAITFDEKKGVSYSGY